MRELKQNTAVIVPMGPAISTGDGYVVVTTIALGSTCDAAILVKHNTSATVSVTSNTWSHASEGQYALSLTAGNVDTPGTMRVQVTDASETLPIWDDFAIVASNVWDSKYGTDKQQVDVTQLDGNAVQQTGGHIHALDDNGGDLSTATAIAALNDITTTNVRTSLTNQGYTTTRAAMFPATGTIATTTEITALNDITTTNVRTSLTNQGYTTARAAMFPASGTIASTNTLVSSNVIQWMGTACNAPDTAGYPVVTVKDGTGAGEIDLYSGVVLAYTEGGAAAASSAAVAALHNISTTNVRTSLTNQGYTTTRAAMFPASGTIATSAEITALNDITTTNVRTSLTNQGWTTARADMFPASGTLLTSASIISTTDVRTSMTNQGYTTTRAEMFPASGTLLTSASIISTTDVRTSLTNQGYTTTRAAMFPASGTISTTAEITALNNITTTNAREAAANALNDLSTSAISTTPSGWTWPDRVNAVFLRLYAKGTIDKASDEQSTYEMDGATVVAVQSVTDDDTTQTRGVAT